MSSAISGASWWLTTDIDINRSRRQSLSHYTVPIGRENFFVVFCAVKGYLKILGEWLMRGKLIKNLTSWSWYAHCPSTVRHHALGLYRLFTGPLRYYNGPVCERIMAWRCTNERIFLLEIDVGSRCKIANGSLFKCQCMTDYVHFKNKVYITNWFWSKVHYV